MTPGVMSSSCGLLLAKTLNRLSICELMKLSIRFSRVLAVWELILWANVEVALSCLASGVSTC